MSCQCTGATSRCRIPSRRRKSRSSTAPSDAARHGEGAHAHVHQRWGARAFPITKDYAHTLAAGAGGLAKQTYQTVAELPNRSFLLGRPTVTSRNARTKIPQTAPTTMQDLPTIVKQNHRGWYTISQVIACCSTQQRQQRHYAWTTLHICACTCVCAYH